MKKISTLVLAGILMFNIGTTTAMAYNKDITLPTEKLAFVDGKIKSEIVIDKETSLVNPWLYVDIKLDAMKAKQGKYNYAELALKRAFAVMNDNKLSLKDGDFYIILNNGFVINKKNYADKKVTEVAMKEILEQDFYKGDTLFKIAYLYNDNIVEKTTNWKLIDTIDLPAGSSHTLTKKYTAGISQNEEINIGQTLGLKFITEDSIGGGIDFKYASAKLLAKLNGEVNKTVSKVFKNNGEVKSSFESTTNISYNPSDINKVILRYQLVDNYKIDSIAFKEGTKKLLEAINTEGINIVKASPSAGENGVDVPMDQIFDVCIIK